MLAAPGDGGWEGSFDAAARLTRANTAAVQYGTVRVRSIRHGALHAARCTLPQLQPRRISFLFYAAVWRGAPGAPGLLQAPLSKRARVGTTRGKRDKIGRCSQPNWTSPSRG
jgi:hypothetical protein